jgi:MerR family transcriptional regulator, thiopeptide resistance regulator
LAVKQLRVGELAASSGLSVRTLHHYDHIGLLAPSGHTGSGHRLYTTADIRRLQQILSLRSVGFALDEIKQALDHETLSLHDVTALHIKRIREQMSMQKTLLQRLEMIEQRILSSRQLTIDHYIETIEAIVMSENKAGPNLNKAVPILDVSDYATSMTYYVEKLGFRSNWDWDGFGSVSRDNVEIFLSHNPEGMFNTAMTVFVKDVAAIFKELQDNQANIAMEPTRMKWGVIELRVRDLDGHMIRFTQPLPEDELEIERTEIRPRIEKRLAAVLEELARETGRSTGEVLEETLLHSFEPIKGQEGQASASPHTIETLDLIHRLKEKHQLHYGTHDSYGFVEKEK